MELHLCWQFPYSVSLAEETILCEAVVSLEALLHVKGAYIVTEDWGIWPEGVAFIDYSVVAEGNGHFVTRKWRSTLEVTIPMRSNHLRVVYRLPMKEIRLKIKMARISYLSTMVSFFLWFIFIVDFGNDLILLPLRNSLLLTTAL